MTTSAVSVSNVWKNFRLYHERNRYLKAAILRGRRARYEEFWALKDVSMEVPPGSTFGIIGSNGSGKSTLLKLLAGILTPDKGSISIRGRLSALLELGAGFHPDLSGRENVFLNGAILGMSRREISLRFDAIVDFAGLDRFIDTPVKNYSSGMTVRLGFAIAAHVDPEILLIDEVLSVGDQSFQRKSYEKIEQFRSEGRTIIIVSHGISQVQELCEQVAWLEKGELRTIGDARTVVNEYTGEHYAQRMDIPESRGQRWGSGRATIRAVQVLDSAGSESSIFRSNAPMTLRVEFENHAVIEDEVVYLKISAANGSELWSSSSKSVGLTVPKRPGLGSVELRIENLPLLEGTYFVTSALRNRTETVEFDHWENCQSFEVHQTNRFDCGPVAIDGMWRSSN